MRNVNNQKRLSKFEETAGICCFIAGLAAPVLGGLFAMIEWIAGGTGHPWLHFASTTLFVVGIPLILFAGFCLDWAERGQKKTVSKTEKVRRGAVGFAHIIVIAGVLGIGLLSPTAFQAQQTIFNVPSTDVLDRGKVYAELDVSFKPAKSASVTKFSSFVPRVVVGVGKKVEVGLNIIGNIQPGPDSTALVPTIKWRPYQGEDNGWAFVVGDNVFVPVRNHGYNAGNYVYAEMSKTFKSGTRVTFGGYGFTRNVVAATNRAGGQFGFEQPVSKKVTVAADWITGKHTAGYFTPGLIFKAGPRLSGYTAYSIGNQITSSGNHFFLLELGYNFD